MDVTKILEFFFKDFCYLGRYISLLNFITNMYIGLPYL
jgi:hypothetical protein